MFQSVFTDSLSELRWLKPLGSLLSRYRLMRRELTTICHLATAIKARDKATRGHLSTLPTHVRGDLLWGSKVEV